MEKMEDSFFFFFFVQKIVADEERKGGCMICNLCKRYVHIRMYV